jgi:hypothetical protein
MDEKFLLEERPDEKAEKSAASVSEQTLGLTLARTLLDELKADKLPSLKKSTKLTG